MVRRVTTSARSLPSTVDSSARWRQVASSPQATTRTVRRSPTSTFAWNKARRVAADDVDDRGRAGDVAPHDAERLAERRLDQSDAMGDTLALGDAGTMRAVHPDRVHLVEVGQRPVALRDVADLGDGRHVGVHAVD